MSFWQRPHKCFNARSALAVIRSAWLATCDAAEAAQESRASSQCVRHSASGASSFKPAARPPRPKTEVYAAFKRAAKTQPPRAAAAHHAESINALACDVRASVDVGFAHGCAGAAFLGADIWLSVGHAHDSNHLQAEHGQAHADANANARVLRAIVRTIAADVSAAQTLESACYCRL